MKKIIHVLLVIALLLTSIFVLTACGEEEEESKSSKKQTLKAAAGNYEGKYTKFVGDTDENKNEEDEFSLELKADGTGISSREGEEYELTWKLKGEKFSMTETFMGLTIDYTGTLKDGKLDIFNGDPKEDFTCEYVYEKE